MQIRTGALVLYKNAPAIVTESGAKITIHTESGADRKVREKDVLPIHPGPISTLSGLNPQEGDIETTWQMMEDTVFSLRELCELAYEAFTPSTAWSAWQMVQDGLYFEGDPDAIRARSPDSVRLLLAEREKKAQLEERKEKLLDRIRAGKIEEEDRSLIGDVESLARGLSSSSKTMKDLGMREDPERAHGLLLRLGVWSVRENPYPYRFGVPRNSPADEAADFGETDRRDLTHLEAYAIDDESTTAADDAVSVDVCGDARSDERGGERSDGEYLWVHIADPAETVGPGSAADLEAMSRGSTLHAPERTCHMLSDLTTEKYSLGVEGKSPALSFKIAVSDAGELELCEIVRSWVRVQRMTYTEADVLLRAARKADPPIPTGQEKAFKSINRIDEICERSYHRRMIYAAPSIDLPEVKFSVGDEITVSPLHMGPSRNLVLESMLMVGHLIGKYAIEHDIPIPFTVQAEPDIDEVPTTLASMWSARRRYRRSEHTTIPGAHAGLGLSCYVQSTSPLRRYLDLLAHQQLTASLIGGKLRDCDEITEAISQSDMRSADVTRAERASNRHITLAYLVEHEGWTGEAVVVGNGKNCTVIVPELALDAELIAREQYDLDEVVYVTVDKIRIPTLECFLRPA